MVMVPKNISIWLNPFGTPFGGPDAPKVPKMEKQHDTVLKPYYMENSMDIMPFDIPNFEN